MNSTENAFSALCMVEECREEVAEVTVNCGQPDADIAYTSLSGALLSCAHRAHCFHVMLAARVPPRASRHGGAARLIVWTSPPPCREHNG